MRLKGTHGALWKAALGDFRKIGRPLITNRPRSVGADIRRQARMLKSRGPWTLARFDSANCAWCTAAEMGFATTNDLARPGLFYGAEIIPEKRGAAAHKGRQGRLSSVWHKKPRAVSVREVCGKAATHVFDAGREYWSKQLPLTVGKADGP